jgi:hypothetical protein
VSTAYEITRLKWVVVLASADVDHAYPVLADDLTTARLDAAWILTDEESEHQYSRNYYYTCLVEAIVKPQFLKMTY